MEKLQNISPHFHYSFSYKIPYLSSTAANQRLELFSIFIKKIEASAAKYFY